MRIGIDLGGTKIECLALGDDGRVLHRRRVATPAGDYDATVAAIAGLVEDARARCGAAQGIGIGTPGSISRVDGRMKNCNSTCLNGRALREDLERALGQAVHLANDANCFALSEATDGAGAGAAVVFGVILGTGVGGGLVVNGRVLEGPNGIAGEWGHNFLALAQGEDWAEPAPCYCGRSGCVETVLSGPAFEREHARRTGGPLLPAAQIARGAQSGDAPSLDALARYARRLAQALATVINIVDPDVIVLGGGLSNIDALYELVPRHWARWVFSDRVATRLVRNRHGDASGVRGAAWLRG
jgi:predicted NBD/HSP70 family sugar kinase